MNKLILILLFLVLGQGASAQYKVKEKSRKATPDWINSTEREYLIISATASTIEEAKEKIMVLLRNQIVKAIATNVVSQTVITSKQENANENYAYSEQMQSRILSKAGTIPFVKNISLSKAEDFYWEKLYDKPKKAYFYEYHIKYRMSSKELTRLVREFNAKEEALDERLNSIQSRVGNVSSVEEIERLISELKGLNEEFMEGDSRKAQADRLSNECLNLYPNIRLEELESGEGYTAVGLYLGDRLIRCDKSPLVKSNCATKFAIHQQPDGTFRVGYDAFNCYADDENYLEIRFLLGTRSLSKKCYIKVKSEGE